MQDLTNIGQSNSHIIYEGCKMIYEMNGITYVIERQIDMNSDVKEKLFDYFMNQALDNLEEAENGELDRDKTTK